MNLIIQLSIQKEAVNIILGKSVKKDEMPVIDYCNNYFHSYLENNPNFSLGTKKNYRKSIKHFNNFLSFCGKQKLIVKGFTPALAEDFKQYLENSYPAIDKIGMNKILTARRL